MSKTRNQAGECWKVSLDAMLILMALPGLIFVAPFIALLIRSVSKGPVLFRQERIGYMGKRFTCFKFRTMHVAAPSTAHEAHLRHLMRSNTPMLKMESKGDPRIIPFGMLLRASGLDELPQLLNVARGEMSLVGPRPCLPYEYEQYLPWQKERFQALPGLTGLWQVSGKNKTTFVEMIQCDIVYAKNKCLSEDLRIILRTIPALVIQMAETRQARRNARSGIQFAPPRLRAIQVRDTPRSLASCPPVSTPDTRRQWIGERS